MNMNELRNRFWPKVKITNGCWPWRGATIQGYGVMYFGRVNNQSGTQENILAHRAAWELTYGKIPARLNVLHSCDNPLCVNPKHLFLGTQRDNVCDMYSKNRQNNVGRRRLYEKQIIEIKRRLSQGQRPVDVAPVFEITQQYASKLRSYTPRWMNV